MRKIGAFQKNLFLVFTSNKTPFCFSSCPNLVMAPFYSCFSLIQSQEFFYPFSRSSLSLLNAGKERQTTAEMCFIIPCNNDKMRLEEVIFLYNNYYFHISVSSFLTTSIVVVSIMSIMLLVLVLVVLYLFCKYEQKFSVEFILTNCEISLFVFIYCPD